MKFDGVTWTIEIVFHKIVNIYSYPHFKAGVFVIRYKGVKQKGYK